MTVLDDLSTGSMQNVKHLLDHQAFRLQVGSILHPEIVVELVDACDVVVHLAAAVGVQLVIERPALTIETNVVGTDNVLRAAASRRKLVLLASTSEVYGKRSKVPFCEDDDLSLGPTTSARWSYACSKALDEWLAFAYAQEKGLPVIICRFFNTTGPRQTGRYGMVVPRLVEQALTGQDLTIYGTGEQTRCFCHVRDTVEVLVRLLGSQPAIGQVFNVGSENEVSIQELAARVKAITGSASRIVYVPYQQAYGPGFEDMARRVPDVTKLVRVTGFRPMTPLDVIIQDVAEDYRIRNRMA